MEVNSFLERISNFQLQESAPTNWEDFAQKATRLMSQIDDEHGFSFLEQPGNMLTLVGLLRNPLSIQINGRNGKALFRRHSNLVEVPLDCN